MLDMAITSAKLFFAGKLFHDNGKAYGRIALAALPGAALTVVLGQVAPIWIAVPCGGLLAGFLMPILFKDLKFR